MTPRMLFRRSLMAAAVGAGPAGLGKRASLFAITGGRVRNVAPSDALAMLCAGLDCAPEIGEACLRVLPGTNSKELLAKLVLCSIGPVDGNFASAHTLAHAVRQRSHDDFRSGRIVAINGWMLSMTETRLYALATLLSRA